MPLGWKQCNAYFGRLHRLHTVICKRMNEDLQCNVDGQRRPRRCAPCIGVSCIGPDRQRYARQSTDAHTICIASGNCIQYGADRVNQRPCEITVIRWILKQSALILRSIFALLFGTYVLIYNAKQKCWLRVCEAFFTDFAQCKVNKMNELELFLQ